MLLVYCYSAAVHGGFGWVLIFSPPHWCCSVPQQNTPLCINTYLVLRISHPLLLYTCCCTYCCTWWVNGLVGGWVVVWVYFGRVNVIIGGLVHQSTWRRSLFIRWCCGGPQVLRIITLRKRSKRSRSHDDKTLKWPSTHDKNDEKKSESLNENVGNGHEHNLDNDNNRDRDDGDTFANLSTNLPRKNRGVPQAGGIQDPTRSDNRRTPAHRTNK